jgi:hypothetical protein
MRNITRSVGNRAINQSTDVCTVQNLINDNIGLLIPHLKLKVDGDCGPVTIGMIIEFQRRVMGIKKPDGRVDPGKNTIKALNKILREDSNVFQKNLFNGLLLQVQNYLKLNKEVSESSPEDSKTKVLTENDYAMAAIKVGVETAAIKAISKVESRGSGFLSNGKPKILFEGHWFSKFTKGAHNAKYPTISYSKWTKKYYKGGTAEYNRYNTAKTLDSTAAMKSTSWGKFQIMGFNYSKAGYSSVETFVSDMYVSEGKQLLALVNFLKAAKLDVPLKAKDWATFAKGYNGPKYAENKYDIRLKQAYEAYSAGEK